MIPPGLGAGRAKKTAWGQKGNLNFIHVPRAAGTTIESCSKFFPADRPRWGTMNPSIRGGKKIYGRREKCYGQHVPPALFPKTQTNPYKDHDTNFCVVRHPYDRLISQFGFVNIFSKKGKYSCTPASMNEYLLTQLKIVEKGQMFIGDCHFVPESLFVFGYDPKTMKPNR